jgi:ketosteroid isomerase-like protein
MSTEDIEAIRQLTASYNRAYDEQRAADWANHFTEDGFFERSNAGRSYRGREEIAGLCSSFDYPVHGRHVTSEHIINVNGDTATQTCYLQFLNRDKGFTVDLFAVYEDELVKVDGKWLFSSRLCNVDEA